MSSEVEFFKHIYQKATLFKSIEAEEVYLFHHNDTDGLTSGAICKAAFEREGKLVRSYALEIPYLSFLEDFFNQAVTENSLIIFADFASGILPQLEKFNKSNAKIFVLDHHKISAAESINLINCLDFNISGFSDCSASIVCYLFAQALSKDNIDLAWLGALGAVGDQQIDNTGKATGLNLRCLNEAISYSQITSPLLHTESQLGLYTIRRHLNALGSFAYFSSGSDIAVTALLNGLDQGFIHNAIEAEKKFVEIFTEFSAEQSNLKKEKSLLYFDLEEKLFSMGVKSVGLFCERLLGNKIADENSYLLGFQKIKNSVPGFGTFNLDASKVSMRVGAKLLEEINSGTKASIDSIIEYACKQVGAESGSCHLHAGSAVVPENVKNDFIQVIIEAIK